MPNNISRDFNKGNIKDLYDYSMEAMNYQKTKEVWPNIMAEKSVDGDHWQGTSVIGPKKLKKTSQNEGFTVTLAREGYTVYSAVFDYTDAVTFSYDAVRDIKKFKNMSKRSIYLDVSVQQNYFPKALVQ